MLRSAGFTIAARRLAAGGVGRSYERAIAGFKRAADNWREKSADVTAQQKRLDLQSQTIAASELEIKSNLQGRNQACKPGL